MGAPPITASALTRAAQKSRSGAYDQEGNQHSDAESDKTTSPFFRTERGNDLLPQNAQTVTAAAVGRWTHASLR